MGWAEAASRVGSRGVRGQRRGSCARGVGSPRPRDLRKSGRSRTLLSGSGRLGQQTCADADTRRSFEDSLPAASPTRPHVRSTTQPFSESATHSVTHPVMHAVMATPISPSRSRSSSDCVALLRSARRFVILICLALRIPVWVLPSPSGPLNGASVSRPSGSALRRRSHSSPRSDFDQSRNGRCSTTARRRELCSSCRPSEAGPPGAAVLAHKRCWRPVHL